MSLTKQAWDVDGRFSSKLVNSEKVDISFLANYCRWVDVSSAEARPNTYLVRAPWMPCPQGSNF